MLFFVGFAEKLEGRAGDTMLKRLYKFGGGASGMTHFLTQ